LVELGQKDEEVLLTVQQLSLLRERAELKDFQVVRQENGKYLVSMRE